MNIDDLNHIFKQQLDDGATELFYMAIDPPNATVYRHPTNDLPGMLLALNSFRYDGTVSGRAESLPKFAKRQSPVLS